MTAITDILADLEAKAKQAIAAFEAEARGELWEGYDDLPSMRHAAVDGLKRACSPGRILALVAYVRKLEDFARRVAEAEELFAAEVEGLLADHLDAGEGKR